MKQNILKACFALFAIASLTVSCKKNINTEQENNAEALSEVSPAPPYTWSSLPVPDNQIYPGNDPKTHVFTTKVNNTWWAFAGYCFEKAYKLNTSTMRWSLQPSYGSNFCIFDNGRYFFAYGSKIYYGFEQFEGNTFKSFDPVTGNIIQLANMPVTPMDGIARFFVIGDNAYLFLEGREDIFYRYNIPGNTWTNMGSSPNGKRHGATVVVMGDKVYVGLGWESTTFGGQTFRGYKRDWKSVTIGSTYGATKANFPGDLRNDAEHFVIGDNIYVGFGNHYSPNNSPTTTSYKDLWKYNTNSNAWTRQPDFPGTLVSGYNTYSAFAIGTAGYFVTGGLNGFWRFANTPLITTEQ